MAIKLQRRILLAVLLGTLAGCASTGPEEECLQHDGPTCPPANAINDPFINDLYESRTWIPEDELEFDPIELAVESTIPVQFARTKFLGAEPEDAANSLAAKIWMIENAQYTVDATYYIFKRDLAGEAILGALCNAVQRGVDVRLMVDSVGSIDTSHAGLKALATCADQAGYIRTPSGEISDKRARVQVIVFNALSKVFVRINRRSHDKLLVVDGHFPEFTRVMTGGRNVSLSYYGINADGTPNPDTYMDAEILLRSPARPDDYPLGYVAERYYSILFLFGDNKKLDPWLTGEAFGVYESDRTEAQQALARLKTLPIMKASLDRMPEFFGERWHETKVLIAHELDNLTNENIFRDAVQDSTRNENSILHILRKVRGEDYMLRRIVSPYLFAAQYYDDDGNIVFDGAKNARDWLDRHPKASLEIITNSVLTSDNFPAQSVIDMNMAPRLLLTKELQDKWLEARDGSELNVSLVNSSEWKKLVSHPRLKIYETGRLDDRRLGGSVDYGKLHSKYIVMDDAGFVGTTNMDTRSQLINNEMGFFFKGEAMAADLHKDFELLKSRSYLWGSPEWLELRRRVFELDGLNSAASKNQRTIYKSLRAMGLDNQL